MAVKLKLVLVFLLGYKHTIAGKKSQCAIMTNIGEIATGHNVGFIRRKPKIDWVKSNAICYAVNYQFI
jgi:hypothetical protein